MLLRGLQRIQFSHSEEQISYSIIIDLLHELHRTLMFSKIDLQAKYYEIRVREEDIPRTEFETHQEHYEF